MHEKLDAGRETWVRKRRMMGRKRSKNVAGEGLGYSKGNLYCYSGTMHTFVVSM